jgi:hypothetical protein
MLRSSICSSLCKLGLVILALLLAGCGGKTGDGSSEWTVDAGALTLERDLLAGDDENFYFGEIHDIAVRGDGSMYVADGKASHVKVLTPDGTLQDTIGRKGKGPGEFNRPAQVHLARGDSLYVADGYWSALSVFASNHEFVRRISLRLQPRKKLLLFPGEVMPKHNGPGFLVRYSASSLPGTKAPEGSAIRTVRPDGTAGDTLFTVPESVMHVEREEGRTTYRSIPFARGSFVAMGPAGRVHYAWSDSLGVRTYGPDGTLRHTVDIPFEPVPVTEADRERELSGRSKESKAAVEDKIPATKPAFEHFLVDDVERYWFGRPTANPDSTDWWVAWPDEQRVGTTTLPSEVQLLEVTNGRAYGQTTTENGASALVRYRVRVTQ